MFRSRSSLGARLKSIRVSHEYSGEQLAKAMGYSQSGVSRVESGKLRPTKDYIRDFCNVLKLRRSERQELEELADAFLHSFYRTYWEKDSILAKAQADIGKREQASKEIRDFEWRVVLGLLQTEEYARAIIKSASRPLSEKTLESAVKGRIARQDILLEKTPMYQGIMYEGALFTPILDRKDQIAQLRHLQRLIRDLHHDIRILPQSKRWGTFPGDSFRIYDSRLVSVGTMTVNIELFEEEDINLYRQIFTKVFEQSVGGNNAIETIESAIERISAFRDT